MKPKKRDPRRLEDLAFLAWLRTATPREIERSLNHEAADWRRIAIRRALNRLHAAT